METGKSSFSSVSLAFPQHPDPRQDPLQPDPAVIVSSVLTI